MFVPIIMGFNYINNMKEWYAMTRFEQVGVNYQYDAGTKQQALKSFQPSCYCCCMKGMRIECDRCAIAEAHNNVIACFADKEAKK